MTEVEFRWSSLKTKRDREVDFQQHTHYPLIVRPRSLYGLCSSVFVARCVGTRFGGDQHSLHFAPDLLDQVKSECTTVYII